MYTHYIIGRLKKYGEEQRLQPVLSTRVKLAEISLLHRQSEEDTARHTAALSALQQRQRTGRRYIRFAQAVLESLDPTDRDILTQFYIARNRHRLQDLTHKYGVDYAILMQMKQDALHRASRLWRNAERDSRAGNDI